MWEGRRGRRSMWSIPVARPVCLACWTQSARACLLGRTTLSFWEDLQPCFRGAWSWCLRENDEGKNAMQRRRSRNRTGWAGSAWGRLKTTSSIRDPWSRVNRCSPSQTARPRAPRRRVAESRHSQLRRLEQLAIRVPPHVRPYDFPLILVERFRDQRHVDAVDLHIAFFGIFVSPVLP